jgi:sterol 24-C-methyltransferase
VDYYNRLESRVTYALMLKGDRHFGYYPPGQEDLTVAAAVARMEDRLAEALALPAGALVLDAGCGRGGVALHLATHAGLRVEGVDLQAGDVRRATEAAARAGAAQRASFQVMDFTDLRQPDGHFDGAYTMEALCHAPDVRAALAGFHRVLRPGGRLALFEYSVAPRERLTARQRELFDAIAVESAMHSLPAFVHGAFTDLLHGAGFADVVVEDATERIMPMLRWMVRCLWLPYQLGRLLGRQRRTVNALAAVEALRARGVWRYNIVTATRPP